MLYYIAPAIIGFYYGFLKNRAFSDDLHFIFVTITAFIYCGGYMTGSDWPAYEQLYMQASYSNLYEYEHEKGFYLFMLVFKTLGFGFFPFLIVAKLFVFTTFCYFIKKYFKSFLLPFSIFLLTDALFIFVDNPLRYMLALGIVIFAFDALIRNRTILFLILIGIAFLFHSSSILMLLCYFVRSIDISRFWIASIYILLSVFWTPTVIIYLLEHSFPEVAKLINWYFINLLVNEDTSYYTIGWFFKHFLFFVVLYKKERIISNLRFGQLFYNLSILSFLLSALLGLIPTFFRVPIYLGVFIYISLAVIVKGIEIKSIFIKLSIVMYILLACIKNIYSTYVYIPYTNYFVCLFHQEVPFEERVKHNKVKYFERTGKYPPEPFDPNAL